MFLGKLVYLSKALFQTFRNQRKQAFLQNGTDLFATFLRIYSNRLMFDFAIQFEIHQPLYPHLIFAMPAMRPKCGGNHDEKAAYY